MRPQKYDKINFLYRNPTGIFSPYMYFEGLKNALERNGLLHYSFDVLGSKPLDMEEMLKYPILCVTGSSEPLLQVVRQLAGRQFLAELWTESFCTSQGELKGDLYQEVEGASRYFDIFFSPAEIDLERYWGKPCYWLPSWAHTELLGDHWEPLITDRIGFFGQRRRREEFFARDRDGILFPFNTNAQPDARQNVVELGKGINSFSMLVNPQSIAVQGMPGKSYEIMACNRLCFNELDESSMFQTRLLFEDGVDLVYFRSFEELQSKFGYYREHRDALERVALSGFRKVRHYHSADARARQIAQRLLHHANGAGYEPSFNAVSAFAPAESPRLFPVSSMATAKPFMKEFEISALRSALQSMRYGGDVLEWGSGASTLYFSQFISPESRWVSIEHNADWAGHVSEQIRQRGRSNIALHLIPNNAPFQDGVDDGSLEAFFDYVTSPARMGGEYDFILVDGRARTACMAAAWDLLAPEGIMTLHDAQRPEYHVGIPENAFCLWVAHESLKDGEEPIATLFMARTAETLQSLGNLLSQSLGSATVKLVQNRRAAAQPPPPSGRPVEEGLTAPPAIFTIETALGCDLRCPECATGCGLITRPKAMMSFDSFKVIADKIRPYAQYVYLHNWGEPLLNPDIFRIIAYTARFAPCNISTNGMSMTPEKAEALICSGVSDILMSIDGVSQESYQKYRVGGRVDQAFRSLALLVEANGRHGGRVKIVPQFVVFEHNQHEMSEFSARCAELGLRPSFKAPYIRKGSSRYRFGDNPEFHRTHFHDIADMRAAIATCTDPREVCTVLVDGSVVICCNDYNGTTSFGNLMTQEVMEIWNGAACLGFRNDIVTGNCPSFCVENCMVWVLDEKRPADVAAERFQNLLQKKSALLEQALAAGRSAAATRKDQCLFLNTYYGAFLDSHYRGRPGLAAQPYQAQLQSLQYECFGDSDFYSRGLIEAGMAADDLIINCVPLQQAWAGENGSAASGVELVVEQVRRRSPEVLYIQDINNTSGEFLDAVRPFVGVIVGQVATPVSQHLPFGKYDVLISSFPHYVAKFRSVGLTSYYQPLAFEPRVLEQITLPQYRERPIGCSFVGGISGLHVESYRLLEVLAENTPIEFWGYGAETLPEGSLVRQRHHGPAWGKEMFQIIGRSRITINRHGEVAENYANNMRLFEATGCGALLITDYKDNLNELFEIGKEIVAFRSPEECAALVNYYLAHPEEAEAIARAGQQRTLRDHSYGRRMAQSAELLGRHLRYRREAGGLSLPERVSDGHQPIAQGEVTPAMEAAWKDPGIPARQRALVQQELQAMYRGDAPIPFQVLAGVLGPIVSSGSSVLEIGCASGYYYEVLEYLLNRRIAYTGVDYSESMIAMAKDYYPKANFYAADGACLFFADRCFETVISSGVLLHVPNYREHIFESARVAEKYLVAARTPVCRKRPTQYLKKFAYGVETVQLSFNEEELLREFALNGFKLAGGTEYYSDPASDNYEVTYMFQRERR